MKSGYRTWLEQQKYDAGTITAPMHRATRVDKHYGDLDDHYAADRLDSVVEALRYSMGDKRHNRPMVPNLILRKYSVRFQFSDGHG